MTLTEARHVATVLRHAAGEILDPEDVANALGYLSNRAHNTLAGEAAAPLLISPSVWLMRILGRSSTEYSRRLVTCRDCGHLRHLASPCKTCTVLQARA